MSMSLSSPLLIETRLGVRVDVDVVVVGVILLYWVAGVDADVDVGT
jgi:hypothetical protein